MLYKTTRENNDAYTAYRALHENTAPDGGAFIPFRMPVFTTNELKELISGGFSVSIAEVLNKFFVCHLTAWDIDFCIGRNAVQLEEMSHRIAVAELWHNPDGTYDYVCRALYNKICGTVSETPTEWFVIATQISTLFGIYSDMCNNNLIIPGEVVDITVLANDLMVAVSSVYARQMGLPLGNIIMTCEDNGDLWDLINLGELPASARNADPVGFERLVHATLGNQTAEQLRISANNSKTFRISEDQHEVLRGGLFCSVVGKDRSMQSINSVYRSNSYFLDVNTALTIAGLQDYRAKTGGSKLSLVLSCTSPYHNLNEISNATGIAREKLSIMLKNPKDRR